MNGRGYGEGPFVDPIGSFTTGHELEPARDVPNLRVIRGGGYFTPAFNCKASWRGTELGPVPGVGFRLARTLSPVSP
jgi:hypothetical protein